MTELKRLIELWEQNELAPADAQRLTELLGSPDVRAALVRESFDRAVITDVLRSSTVPAGDYQDAKALVAQQGRAAASAEHLSRHLSSSGLGTHYLARWAIAATLLLAISMLGWLSLKSSRSYASLIAQSDNVSVYRGNKNVEFDHDEPLSLHPGDMILTGDDASARIMYANESTWVDLADHTQLQVLQTNAGKRIVLRSGRFEADVAPQPKDRPMICQTELGKATVLGTRFFMTADKNHATLEVQEGTVRLRVTGGTKDTKVQEQRFAESHRDGSFQQGTLGANGRFEAEALAYQDAQGIVYMRREEGKASGDYQRDFLPNQIGDAVTFIVNVTEPGDYQVVIGTAMGVNRGIYQLAIADGLTQPFKDQGQARDYYSQQVYAYKEFELGNVSFQSSGKKHFRFTCRGKRSEAHKQMKLGIDYIELVRVSAI